MQFVIVTGLSGAGKSYAMNVLEDIGFYCIDNMPPKLILKFIKICINQTMKILQLLWIFVLVKVFQMLCYLLLSF